ncbi:MAG: type III pantothenate kinase [Atopobiaceae bacterium]|jgi:type III pantothenate kinase|nr:type III pantothenate kinase [Atopobiaceae bacterium]
MFLSIDVGNTQTTIALFDEEGACTQQWRMASAPSDTSDSLHARLYSYFQMYGLSLADVDAAALASVVPLLTDEWCRGLHDALDVETLVVDARRDCGIEIGLAIPEQAGADRVANALAARTTYGAPVIVVDFGTATNIDVVDADGVFRGGAIMPGIKLSAEALFSRAAKLSSVPLVAPDRALGDTTETAVQSGLLIGAAANAEGIVHRIQRELGIEGCPVVGTGGYARRVAKATDLFCAIDPDLTTRGIYQIWLHRAEKRGERD